MSAPVSARTSTPAKLRQLSSYERLFLALDKINGFNFGMAFCLSSAIEQVQWIRAFDQLRKRHPLLRAGINEDDPHAPYFISGAELPIPMAFKHRISSTEWQLVMESDIAEPFDLASGPLLRPTVLQDEMICDLVITANHVVIDGMGIASILGGELTLILPISLAATLMGLIVLPHVTWTFALAVFGEFLFQAVAFSIQIGIVFEAIGPSNPLAATTFAFLTAATNIPVTYMLVADGRAYSAAGIVGALSADASISIAACLVMGIVLLRFFPIAAGATVPPSELAPAMQPSEGDL